MPRPLQLFACFAVFLSSATFLPASESRLYSDALQAINEGIPEVGIQKLQTYLAGNLDPAERNTATLKLAGALLDADRPGEALQVLGKIGAGPDPDRDYLKAQILSALGRWSEASTLFHALGEVPGSPLFARARIGEAESLYALDRPTEAAVILESLPNPGTEVKLRLADFYFETHEEKKCAAILASVTPATPSEIKWREYLEGRESLAKDQPAEAMARFEKIIKDPQGVGEGLLAGATLGMAEGRLIKSGPEAADDVLADFIQLHPESRYLELIFRRLDQIDANEENPSDSELLKWSQAPPTHRQALATFYLAKSELRAKETEQALATLEAFTRDYPDHPLASKALLMKGAILAEAGNMDPALAAFEAAMRKAPDSDALAEAEIASGRVQFKQHENVLAAGMFRSAAGHSQRLWQTAVFDSALAWLNQGNYEKFLEDYNQLSARFPESNLRSELLLEEGLMQARTDDPRARASLRLFIQDFPDHTRVAEARLALAEIAFLSSDFRGARYYLQEVNDTPQAIETSDRAEYLAIFLADAAEPHDDQKVVEDCLKFIQERKKSALLPEVRMKLGQIYYRREDFASARTQFELLAAESPDTPYGEMALFLAGKSAMQSMDADSTNRALELFEQVAKLNGSLKLYARQQEAQIKSRPGTESDAVILYDDILNSKPDAELKFSALCGKGDNYFAMGGSDPKAFNQAIEVYDTLAKDPDATLFWRNQALYKKGKCLEKENKPAEALEVYYDVLQSGTGAGAEPDYYWYYKAGFDAAHLLVAEEQWKSAIGIYQKMAKLSGPRSGEANDRARQLRMDHFIWED